MLILLYILLRNDLCVFICKYQLCVCSEEDFDGGQLVQLNLSKYRRNEIN